MRRITAGLFISLDGVVEDPGDWHFPYYNDEMGVAVDSQLGAADTLLLAARPTTASPVHGRIAKPQAARTLILPRSSAMRERLSCRTRISSSPGATRSS